MEQFARSPNANSIRYFLSPDGSSTIPSRSPPPKSQWRWKPSLRANAQPNDVAAIGIANQRETTIVWDRETGEPVYNAIVWQDRRTADFCERLRSEGHGPLIQQRTGLLIDSYFSASKISWILDNVPGARADAEAGKLAFGTVDTWLLWKLTGGQRSRHRRQQRLAHHALQYPHRRTGITNFSICFAFRSP